MLDHLVALCPTPGLQPDSQNLSNCFLACAELKLGLCQAQAIALLKHLLGQPVLKVNYQNYSIAAWSLAVMGILDIGMFDALLHQLRTKQKLPRESGAKRTSDLLKLEGARQLYQALEWLRPPRGSKQLQAWSSLQSRLQGIARELRPMPRSFPGQLYDALEEQSLQYRGKVHYVPGCTRQKLCWLRMTAMLPRSSCCCSIRSITPGMNQAGAAMPWDPL